MRGAVLSVAALVVCAAAASAQVVKETEPNDKREQAQAIRVGDSVEGLYQVDRDFDFFRLTLDGPGKTMIKIDLSPVPGANRSLSLYDDQGRYIWEDVGDNALSIFGLALAPGTYYVATSAWKANVRDTYVLAVAGLGPWKEGLEAEPNKDAATATEIRPGQSVEGFFHAAGDSDFYKLRVDKPGKSLLQVDLSGAPSVRSTLRILGADQKQLWETYNPTHGQPASISHFAVTEGTYYLVVQGAQKNVAVPYTLSLRILGPWQEGQEAEPNDKKEWANPIKLETPVLGRINNPQDADWYTLDVPAPGLDIMVVEETGISGGLNWGQIEMTDGMGRTRAYGLTGKENGREEIVRLRVEPGTYLLKLRVLRSVNVGAEYTLRVGRSPKTPASAEEVQRALTKALDWLASHQQKDGAWPSSGSYQEAFTGLPLMAFIGGKCVPQDHSANIQAALGFLRSRFVPGDRYPAGSKEAAKSGGVFTTATGAQMYQQAIATLSVVEALVDLDDPSLEPMVQEAVDLILRSQNTERKPGTLGGPIKPDKRDYGGWRYNPDSADSDLSVTGWQVLTLRAAVNAGFTVPDDVFAAAAKYVRSLQGKKDGSFLYNGPGGSGDSCGRAGMGALSLQLCGFPQDPAVAPALRFMQDHAPRWNMEEPGDGRAFYYWYYGTRAMYLAGGDDWRVWKDWMCRFLVDHQNADGSWDGEANESRLDVYRVALGALMLEFCCGHVPIYRSPVTRSGPGTLEIKLEKAAEQEAAKTVEIIMDASNSMTGLVGKETKIAAARRVLKQTIQGLPDAMNVGFRVYGHRYATDDYDNACRDTELLVPIGPVKKAVLTDLVDKIQTKGRTPLVASVLAAIKDFEKIPNGTVVLVTDGIESCKGDIKSIAPAIKSAGLALEVNIVGFDIKEAAAQQELRSIAASTGGRYLDARNADELMDALGQTLKLEFVALDAGGKEAGRGLVGGAGIKLKEGAYTLRVWVSPRPIEVKVTIKPGGRTALTLKRADGAWILQ